MRPPPDDRTVAELLEFGVVPLDKPPGPSAHEVSAWVRDLVAETARMTSDGDIDVRRAAHTGTLDPKVTGLLPTLLGTATRFAGLFADSPKEYVAVLELHAPIPADFESILAEFEGEIYQKPPRKSAVRRQLRVREVHSLDILDRRRRRVLLRIRCEAGTYVRKLCHDLGLALGTGAHMGDLRRTAAAPFDDRDLVSLHDLADALVWAQEGDDTPVRGIVAPAETALSQLPRVVIAESAAREVAHGAPVYAPGVLGTEGLETYDHSKTAPRVACFTPAGTAVCLGHLVEDPAADSGKVVTLDRVLVDPD